MKSVVLALALFLGLAQAAWSGTIVYGQYTSNGTQTVPGTPGGTSSTSGIMLGIAGTITPVWTGNIWITAQITMRNTTVTSGTSVQLHYGTNAAPANGDPVTGTACGTLQQSTSENGAQWFPVTLVCNVTGLTLGTPYWIDMAFASVTSGASSVGNPPVISAFEY